MKNAVSGLNIINVVSLPCKLTAPQLSLAISLPIVMVAFSGVDSCPLGKDLRPTTHFMHISELTPGLHLNQQA